MNVNGILNAPVSRLRTLDCAKRTGPASFQNLLSGVQQAQPYTIRLYLPKENTIYSGGKAGQTVYAEYAAGSTAEDPVVRIMGQANSGAYEFTRRIRDIDPQRASYAELCALWGHLRQSGALSFEAGGEELPVIPCGVDTGDFARRQNYMQLIGSMTTSAVFGQSNRDYAKKLLGIYQAFIDEKLRT